MWEFRLAWTTPPAWWDGAWQGAEKLFSGLGRSGEERPDAYFVLVGRTDVGLKLRGEKDDEFDVKVLHERRAGWELWEKVPFFRWNPLEEVRLAALLGIAPSPQAYPPKTAPSQGAEQLLKSVGIDVRTVRVKKLRMQAAAAALLPSFAATVSPTWLAELVRIELPGRQDFVYSLCLESMEPIRGGIEPVPSAGALCAGYPELLLRHDRGGL